eukprot:NODE_3810_length_1159_cov_102.952703_g3623_i0.p1 GENE.NODE_3810_length_1159_cov_102.952703_g3623_i0~~NODE_3810_length_1159_cov_102.952703_g3623_i0.p1  ORF type:complete len:120 (+),score=2.82 NODE_3810_length_1159_cov_102.952703_g3623_i0:761-1120(+)
MRDPHMAHVLPSTYNRTHRRRSTTVPIFKVPSVDIARYLQENFQLNDFVVCKMDIEGAEYSVIPRLLQTDAVRLVDELFLECHYWELSMLPTVRTRQWHHCHAMLRRLRQRGVYAHEWW